ncbi:unnamed protein product [Amoebophrya sp. A25]|nr:unnamed protein product [Amoebophrya sp. A25]|eukprot:GSA25T00005745001.1
MAQAEDVPSILEAIREKVRDVLSCERAVCFLVDEDQKQIWSPASHDCPKGLLVSAERGIVGIVAKTGEAYVANHVRRDPNWFGDIDENFRTYNLLTVPVKTQTKVRFQVTAVVQAANKRGDFDRYDVEIMSILATEIANHFDRLAFTILHERAKLQKPNQYEMTTALLNSFYKGVGRGDEEKGNGGGEGGAGAASQNTATGGGTAFGATSSLVPRGSTLGVDMARRPERSFALGASASFKETNRLLAASRYDPRVDWVVPYHSMKTEESLGFLLSGFEFALDEIIPAKTLTAVLQDLKDSYLEEPRFHNWGHALQVFHTSCLMDAHIPFLNQRLDSIHLLALFLASVAHDVAHRGKNNAFEIATSSELALLYNDLSVLENHHASLTGSILQKRKFLEQLVPLPSPDGSDGEEETKQRQASLQRQFRKLVVSAILGTDMSKHGELVKRLQSVEPLDNPETVITCCVHCADLGAQALPIDTAWDFYIRCTDEFAEQAKKESELGIPVTPFMTGLDDPKVRAFGQVQFIEFVVLPLWKSCSTAMSIPAFYTYNSAGTPGAAPAAPPGGINIIPSNSSSDVDSAVTSPSPSKTRATVPRGSTVVGNTATSSAVVGTIVRSQGVNRRRSSRVEMLNRWMQNLTDNLEVYKYVAKHGRRKEEQEQ